MSGEDASELKGFARRFITGRQPASLEPMRKSWLVRRGAISSLQLCVLFHLTPIFVECAISSLGIPYLIFDLDRFSHNDKVHILVSVALSTHIVPLFSRVGSLLFPFSYLRGAEPQRLVRTHGLHCDQYCQIVGGS